MLLIPSRMRGAVVKTSDMDGLIVCKNAVAWVKGRAAVTAAAAKLGLGLAVDAAHDAYADARADAAAASKTSAQESAAIAKNDRHRGRKRR